MKQSKYTQIDDTNITLEDLIDKSNDLENDVIELQSNQNQFINKKYSGVTTSSTSFSISNGVYLALLWINAGALVLPALYVVTMNGNGGGAVCCGESGNANLSVSGTTITVRAPYGNAVFYCLTRIST